jgi:hypothetical protein
MRKIEDYRKHAQECRAMLGHCQSEEQRRMVLQMAETWDSLAEQRQSQIDLKKRLEKLGGSR